jgi:hypothetical protein
MAVVRLRAATPVERARAGSRSTKFDEVAVPRAAEPPGRHRRRRACPLAVGARRAERRHRPPPGARAARCRARRRLRHRLHAGRRGVVDRVERELSARSGRSCAARGRRG